MGTMSCAGLCLLAPCACAQSVSARGQYSVTFKIVAGKLAVDRDMFHVAPPLVKLEGAIRTTIRQAIAKIAPLSPDLLIDSAWAPYTRVYESWSAADPARLDLGTLFSPEFLFADLLKQMPDFGLVLNDQEIDPLNGAISFSILPLFNSQTVGIELPAMIPSRRKTRIPQLRKRLARLDGALWSSTSIRSALAPLYSNLALTPQILLFPASATIRIVEGPRISSIILPADQVRARDINRVLWNLLDTRHFRQAKGKRAVDFDRDLGYAPGDEPYATQYQLQMLQLLLAPLGYTLVTQASTRTGASQYVDLRVQSASSANPKKKSRHIAGGFEYKPGQGFSALGSLQLPPLSLALGGPSGTLGSGSYSAEWLGFSANINAGTSEDRNRVLDGVRTDQQTTAEQANFGWEPTRSLDGDTVTFELEPRHAVAFGETINTIQPGVQFLHNKLTSEHPWRATIGAHVLIDARFSHCLISANTHRSFDRWDYDFTGRFENAFGNPPIFELPSFGGSNTVRGFRADDAIGRRLWADQNELWHDLPQRLVKTVPLKLAAFADVGGAYQTVGSSPGLRAGLGTGLRLDLRVAVLKLDWAYGFGRAATGGSRGKFYVNVVLPTH